MAQAAAGKELVGVVVVLVMASRACSRCPKELKSGFTLRV